MEEKTEKTGNNNLLIWLMLMVCTWSLSMIGIHIYCGHNNKVEQQILDNTEQGRLREDLKSIPVADFRKAIELIKSTDGVLNFYFYEDQKTVSIDFNLSKKDNIRSSTSWVTCETYGYEDQTEKGHMDFCNKRGRKLREMLRKNIPSLAKRPL
ncbi:MAG TPA: hypothetical protein P5096_02590 [Patescibacteria group bacterium]|nr:hypothetical protein [Patescibacteria group bacterium]